MYAVRPATAVVQNTWWRLPLAAIVALERRSRRRTRTYENPRRWSTQMIRASVNEGYARSAILLRATIDRRSHLIEYRPIREPPVEIACQATRPPASAGRPRSTPGATLVI